MILFFFSVAFLLVSLYLGLIDSKAALSFVPTHFRLYQLIIYWCNERNSDLPNVKCMRSLVC